MRELELDIGQLLDAVEYLPGLLDGLLGPVRPQHRDGDRLGGLELLIGLEGLHCADVLGGGVDLDLFGASAGGEGECAEGCGGQSHESAAAGEL
ncbi:MAG: hypothetical protein ACTMKY_14090 [Dermabacteraceae bacterium]|nr:hypothetical protein [Brachybacterium sp.]